MIDTKLGLPEIPVIAEIVTPAGLLKEQFNAVSFKDWADKLLVTAERFYGRYYLGKEEYGAPLLRNGAKIAKWWLSKNLDIPDHYRAELEEVAKLHGDGAKVLNLSTLLACTVGVTKNGKIARTQDWPVIGMGAFLLVHKMAGEAGEFWNITYPGFVGVLSAVAPGRFAATINQAPVQRGIFGIKGLDWAWEKLSIIFSPKGMPGPLALRQGMEECKDFEGLVDFLSKQKLSESIIFTVADPDGNRAIIERTRSSAIIHREICSAANHWQSQWKGYPRDQTGVAGESVKRGKLMADFIVSDSWPTIEAMLSMSPILNKNTRIAAILNPALDAEYPVQVAGLDHAEVSGKAMAVPVTKIASIRQDGTATHHDLVLA